MSFDKNEWKRVRDEGDVSLEQLETAGQEMLKALGRLCNHESMLATGHVVAALEALGWSKVKPKGKKKEED